MIRVLCHTYGVGVFEGVEFREETVSGVRVGVAHTDDRKALAWFERRPQFTVEWGDEPPQRPADTTPELVDLSTLTVPQLREYAAENGIELGDASKKADILAAIQAGTANPEEEDTEPTDADEPPAGVGEEEADPTEGAEPPVEGADAE